MTRRVITRCYKHMKCRSSISTRSGILIAILPSGDRDLEPVLSLSKNKCEMHASPEWLMGRAFRGSGLLLIVFVVKGIVWP